MLNNVYKLNFLIKFFDQSKFELSQMDTDSLYFAIVGKEIEEILVKYINHVIDIEGVDFINERYLYAADFTEKEKTYLMKISKQNEA